MGKLYEICNELENFELKCDENGEILNADELDKLIADKNEKVKNIGKLIKNLKADETMLKNEKDVFDKRLKAVKREQEFYKEYLAKYLNGEKFESDDKTVVISYRNSEKTIVDDMALLDSKYFAVQEPKADLTKIKEDIKNGIDVKGCHIETCSNIQIK